MKKKLLIVDDEALILRATARLFKNDYQVITANTAREAEMLMDLVDVVLTDWNPLGPKVLEECKKPVVVFTANPQDCDAPVRVLEKPVPKELIIEALEEALEQ